MPREHPCFGPISDTKIAIMGGCGENGKLGDVHVFDNEADPEEEEKFKENIKELSEQVEQATDH